MKWICLTKKKVNTQFIQQRILEVIGKHVEQINKFAYFDENVSLDLSRYLKITSEFVEHEVKMRQFNEKEIEQLDESEVNQLILDHAKEIKNEDK